jgi:signal transduction histidine kinase
MANDCGSRAWAALPLMTDEHVFGSIVLSFAQPRTFAPKDQVFILALAQQCSYALERAHLHEAEQQARTSAEAAVHQRDHMLRLISHDLKTPLTTIQGYVRLLQQQAVQADFPGVERYRRGLNHIDAATAQMVTQIQELLDIASLQVGQPITLTQEPLDLVRLVQHVADVCQQMSEQHTIKVDTDLCTLVCTGDRVRLERVFSNLLTNAIKYSPDGGEVVVRVALELCEGARYAVLRVQDEGVGIPPGDLPHIFEPFLRASNVSDVFPGTGLGLTSARQIIEQHGGHMSVTSTLGGGATFAVKLPLLTP